MRRSCQRGTGLPTVNLTSDEVVRKMLVERLILARKKYDPKAQKPKSGVSLRLHKE